MTTNNTDPRIKIFLGIAVAVLVLGFAGIIWAIKSESAGSESKGTPKLALEINKFDFGDVSMANGLAKKKVKITNIGDGDLKISRMQTSCMCTKVTLDAGGKQSPEFGMPGHGGGASGWSQVIKPGESGELEIIFDPNAHGPNATGLITRTIDIFSNDGGQDGTQSTINFSGNVTK
ncbi:MAG: DUF1573 domain-containing protein [Candidatus Magasanikbacteria bacterium]|nr:DUF1573 domain-containing protein [Candidatus Magasanikbacteria bacterium]